MTENHRNKTKGKMGKRLAGQKDLTFRGQDRILTHQGTSDGKLTTVSQRELKYF